MLPVVRTNARSTKIVATSRPGVQRPRSVDAHDCSRVVDVGRMNFSMAAREEHLARAELVARQRAPRSVVAGIMCDLQGTERSASASSRRERSPSAGWGFSILDAEVQLRNQERGGAGYKGTAAAERLAGLGAAAGRTAECARRAEGSGKPESPPPYAWAVFLLRTQGITPGGDGLPRPLTAKDMETSDVRRPIGRRILAGILPKNSRRHL